MRKIEIVIRITENDGIQNEKIVTELLDAETCVDVEQHILKFPGLEIHLEHHRVFKNGVEIYMSRYEYGVLSLMAQHPGRLFTKEQIFEAVWHKDSESYLRAVSSTINRIRQKIEDDKENPRYIKTISNLGYQFMPLDEL